MSCKCETPWDINGMCAICSDFIPDENNTVPIPEPPGKFIINQKDIQPYQTEFGEYYHYSDVCILLSRSNKKVTIELNRDWRDTLKNNQ
jgi:hypothetical protein